jgi:hypothetical protein
MLTRDLDVAGVPQAQAERPSPGHEALRLAGHTILRNSTRAEGVGSGVRQEVKAGKASPLFPIIAETMARVFSVVK